MAKQINPNDPSCVEAAAEILRRHTGGEPEANITTAVRNFLTATGLVEGRGASRGKPTGPGIAPRRGPHRPGHLRRVQAQDRHRRRLQPRPRECSAARRLPGAVAGAGPGAYGNPDRRQAVAPALAQCRIRSGWFNHMPTRWRIQTDGSPSTNGSAITPFRPKRTYRRPGTRDHGTIRSQ